MPWLYRKANQPLPQSDWRFRISKEETGVWVDGREYVSLLWPQRPPIWLVPSASLLNGHAAILVARYQLVFVAPAKSYLVKLYRTLYKLDNTIYAYRFFCYHINKYIGRVHIFECKTVLRIKLSLSRVNPTTDICVSGKRQLCNTMASRAFCHVE